MKNFESRFRRPGRAAGAAAVALAFLVSSACSSDDDAASDAPATTAAADNGAAGDATTTTEASGPRTITHAMGETEVPAVVERVVVLDSSFLDSSVALGLIPVGATEGTASAGLPAYLGDDVTGEIEIVGTTTEPSLESIAALAPDLIIGAKVRHEAMYADLSSIAPTVFSESSGGDWQSQVTLTGESLGLADEAQALLDEFDARAIEVGETIGAAGKTASIVRFIPDQIRLYGPGSFSGSVLTAVGFDLGDKGWNEYHMAIISPEQIEQADGDFLFATNPEVESDGAVSTARGSLGALWDNLPVVAAGNAYDIADTTWMTGIGVLGANLILDDLEEWLG